MLQFSSNTQVPTGDIW